MLKSVLCSQTAHQCSPVASSMFTSHKQTGDRTKKQLSAPAHWGALFCCCFAVTWPISQDTRPSLPATNNMRRPLLDNKVHRLFRNALVAPLAGLLRASMRETSRAGLASFSAMAKFFPCHVSLMKKMASPCTAFEPEGTEWVSNSRSQLQDLLSGQLT